MSNTELWPGEKARYLRQARSFTMHLTPEQLDGINSCINNDPEASINNAPSPHAGVVGEGALRLAENVPVVSGEQVERPEYSRVGNVLKAA